MLINGVNRLACKVLMRDLLPKKASKPLTITIEPIRGLPVQKDLVVDMEPFFDAYRAVKPYLITSGNPPTRERIQSQTDRARYDDTNYMRHTMAYKEGTDLLSDVRLDYKPVVQTRYEPMERKY